MDLATTILTFAALSAAVWFAHPTLQAERRHRATVRARPPVTDEELAAFFDSGTRPDIPARVRRVFADVMEYPADRLLPDDDFMYFWAEMDAAPLIEALEGEFGITLPDDDVGVTPPTIRAVSALVKRLLTADR